MSGLFVQAFNALSSISLVKGEKGMPEFSSTSSNLLDLFTKLIRDLPEYELNRLVAKCFSDIDKGDFKQLVDLFVLTFQTRDCRGGKGEKSLFQRLYLSTYLVIKCFRICKPTLATLHHLHYAFRFFMFLSLFL